MTKKFLCLLLSVILTFTVGGSFVFAEDIDLPMPEDLEILEDMPKEGESEEVLRKLEEIRETITDRFIVKFRDNTNVSVVGAAEIAYASAKDAKDQAVSAVLEAKGVSLENVYGDTLKADPIQSRLKDVLSEIDSSEPALFALDQSISSSQSTEFTVLQEDKQVISLSEKVDTEVFVQEVQDALGEEIEYIQPDYELELAANEDESLSLEVVPISPGDSLESELEAEVGPVPSAEPAEGPEPTEEPAEPETLPSAAPENTAAPAPSTSPESETPEATPKLEPTPSPESVIVAVIDTGIDVTHPDLADHIVDGYNFVSDNEQVYDAELGMEQAHGTHVTGIIAQTAPDAKIMPLKCFENGRAYTSDLIEAIDFAKANGVSIVNCSWGSKDNNQVLWEAMESSGLFFVCAAGNNRMDVDETPIYPASFGLDNSISVTSLNQDYGFSYYSNYGTSIDIAAIGRDVESAFPGGERGKMNGSSMSAGYISGAAAIAKASGEMNLKSRIISTGDRLSNLQNKLKDGRALNLDHLISNTQSDKILDCTPVDDFDVHGYQPTPEENWELFSESDNVQISTGGDFTLVLKENGTVWSWGNNDSGQLGDGTIIKHETPQKIVGLEGIVAIDAGPAQALALQNNGDLYAWGDNTYGQLGDGTNTKRLIPTKVELAVPVSKVSAGRIHSIALTNDGKVYVWGNNNRGQLGDGTKNQHLAPIALSLTNVTEISAGGSHTAAIQSDGTVYTWGYNVSGQIGDGTDAIRLKPTRVNGIPTAKKIAAGTNHTVVLSTAGTIYVWGGNSNGQLGNGTQTLSRSPILINELSNVISISSGETDTTAVCDDGTAYAWGDNAYGQLGDGTMVMHKTPTQIDISMAVADVSVSENHAAAITMDKNIYTWGSNASGQLGIENTENDKYPIPTKTVKITNTRSITAGMYHCLAVMDDNTVMSWGYNSHGQLGDGSQSNRRGIPCKINDLDNVMDVAAGYYHSLAVKKDGTVYSWGYNIYGQLGNGNENTQLTPVFVQGLTNIKEVAAGAYHSLALTEDGTVYSWGINKNGELGDGTNDNKIVPVQIPGLTHIESIAAGYYSSFAVRDDGKVFAWGVNNSGQLGPGLSVGSNYTLPTMNNASNIKKISAGLYHTVALTYSGKILTWGSNAENQCGNSSLDQLTDIQDISAGEYHSLALKLDGSVIAWGKNNYGQLGNGNYIDSRSLVSVQSLTGAVSISAGYGHSLALKTDGTVEAWGNNGSGQIGDGRIFYLQTPSRLGTPINKSPSASLDLSCGTNEIYNLIIKASGMTNYKQRLFTLSYNSTELTVTDLCGQTWQKELTTGDYGNLEIISIEDGTISFRYKVSAIPDNYLWSGVVDVIQFKSHITGISHVSVSYQ